jgi:hypothetical protein
MLIVGQRDRRFYCHGPRFRSDQVQFTVIPGRTTRQGSSAAVPTIRLRRRWSAPDARRRKTPSEGTTIASGEVFFGASVPLLLMSALAAATTDMAAVAQSIAPPRVKLPGAVPLLQCRVACESARPS